MGRTKVRASGHVAGWRVFDCPDVSRRHAKVHHCLARRDRIARAMGRAARRFSPRSRLHTQVHRDRRDRRRGGRRRLTRWRGARAGHHLRDIIGSAIRPNRALAKIKAGVCRRTREVPNGRLLVDSPSDWDHNLGLRAQSRPFANDADTANAGDGSVPARPCRNGNCRRLRPRSHRGTSAADTAMTPSRPGRGACARSWPY